MFSVDSVFMFFCALLVLLMTPALALFYGGLVRSKNVLSTTMHSYTSIVVVSIQWVLIGYTLAFGSSFHGIFGGLDFLGLHNVDFESNNNYSSTIPHSLFMMFQMMFAILTPAVMAGAFAERMKFGPFLVFILLWTTVVYDPLAHWVWGVGGWLRELGALDFAGGTVVHIASGVSGLVVSLVLGKRLQSKENTPHHIPLTILGAGLLWFGWFGFNVGSALTLNSIAMNAFVTTMVAATASSLSWMLYDWGKNKKPTVLGAATGIIAGLVAITPACGFVSVLSAIVIGLTSGVICNFSVSKMKEKLKYDDTLDAFGLHGFGGIWGALATGLFSSKSVNNEGTNGLFFGGGIDLLIKQLIAVGATIIFCALMTFIITKAVNKIIPMRVCEKTEEVGLDLVLHGEKAYN
ncbi:ammonium transporter [Priestia aryabhattai]|uniref:Ammonium transporter n=1 Tax=Priestia aryabhattai TaxID=412384 RepID=A0AAX6NCL6_PRIAR|nr:ammonium transporter [Priestia aryabhattai]MDU9693476.1 ammonium transporter [Priestia aryabhattai]